MNSSPPPNGAGATEPEDFGVMTGIGREGGVGEGIAAVPFTFDFNSDLGAGGEGGARSRSEGVPITFEVGSGSGSPVSRTGLEDEANVG